MPQDLLSYMENTQATRQTKMAHHHALENYEIDLCLVQDLKNKLQISWHWVPGDPEWENTECLVYNQKYQCAVDPSKSLLLHTFLSLAR